MERLQEDGDDFQEASTLAIIVCILWVKLWNSHHRVAVFHKPFPS